MILESLKNAERIKNLHPLFNKAFEYILNTDFSTMKDGTYEIDGKNITASIQHINCKDKAGAAIETHNKYIDIQFPILGVEEIGWKSGNELMEVSSPYDDSKDITFFVDKPTTFFKIYPGEFAIFFPEDGHAPGVGQGLIRKVVVKVISDYKE